MYFSRARHVAVLASLYLVFAQLSSVHAANNAQANSSQHTSSSHTHSAQSKSPTKSSHTTNSAKANTPSSQRLLDWCKRMTPRLPKVSLNECKNSALVPSNAQSRRGIPLMVKEQAAAKGKPEIRVLLLGGIHGDEPTASAIVMEWIRFLNTPDAQAFHWKIAPVVNPDGMLATKQTRVNASGVDLNRNFPTLNWRIEAKRYWAKQTDSDPRRFPGTSPLSEPESRWVNEQVERFKPQVIISVHAPFGVLDFDGPAPPPQRFGRLVFTPVGVYPGSLGNYIGHHKNLPVITIELPNSQSMPPDAEVQRIWLDMLEWIRRNVQPANAKSAKVTNKPSTKASSKTTSPIPASKSAPNSPNQK